MKKRILSFTLSIVLIFSLLPWSQLSVSASETIDPAGDDVIEKTIDNRYAAYKLGDTISYYTTLQDALAACTGSSETPTYTIGILKDCKLSAPLTISGNYHLCLELNGHKLYRTQRSPADNGQVITFSGSQKSLYIYGGRRRWICSGEQVTLPEDLDAAYSGFRYNANGFATPFGVTAAKNAVPMYCFDSDEREILCCNGANEIVKGGAITGGVNTGAGGGIIMSGAGSEMHLLDVFVVGNLSEDDGGGIAMKNKEELLDLRDSKIIFNAVADGSSFHDNDGGGIYLSAAATDATIQLSKSQIAYNLGYDNGGGIATDATGLRIIGDADAKTPTDDIYPSNWDMYVEAHASYGNYYCRATDDFNPYLNRTDSAKNQFFNLDNKTSTIGYNIVMNSCQWGGGGGVYTYAGNMTITHVNVMKNMALGYGLNYLLCGRGAGIHLYAKGDTVSDCNIYDNWASSEGGGVYVNREDCTLNGCTITGNYSDGDGECGGGTAVFGGYTLTLGGRTIIKDNSSDDYAKDDLFLWEVSSGNTISYAYVIPGVANGSEVWVRSKSSTLCNVKGDYDEHLIYADDTNYHVEFSEGKRTLSLVKGLGSVAYIKNKYPEVQEAFLVPENPITAGSRTKKLPGTYAGMSGHSYPLYQGIASYPAFKDASEDLSSTFFYSDGYFDDDPTNYNDHLATASMHLALSSFYSNIGNEGALLHQYAPSEDSRYYEPKAANIRQFLSDIGILEKDIFINDFNIQKPGEDTIGVAIGSKDIEVAGRMKKLVVVGVRGAGYEKEWVSNLTLGAQGEAAGFSSAAGQVFSELQNYLARHEITGDSNDTIFWVAGYSRAGATSNLTGARIVDTYDPSGTHTFVYTFEAPRGGEETVRSNNNQYLCIHNIVNDSDIVPMFGPSMMGFQHYGVDHYVPGNPHDPFTYNLNIESNPYYILNAAGTGKTKVFSYDERDNDPYTVGSGAYEIQKAKMKTQLRAVCDYDIFFTDYFHPATMAYFNSAFGNDLIQEKDKIQGYTDTTWTMASFEAFFIQNFLKTSVNFAQGTDGNNIPDLYRNAFAVTPWAEETLQEAFGMLAGLVFSLTAQEKSDLMSAALGALNSIDRTSLYVGFFKLGTKSISDVYQELWDALETPLKEVMSPEQFDRVATCFPTVCEVLLDYVISDYNKTSNDVLGTFAYNIGRIFMNHYPEVNLAWLRSYDTFYTDETCKMKMSETAKVDSLNAPVIQNHLNDASGNPLIQLSVPGDENQGVGIFYRLKSNRISDEARHPYNGSFSLPPSVFEEGSTCLLETFAVHDGQQSEVVTTDLVELLHDPTGIQFENMTLTLESDLTLNFYTNAGRDVAMNGQMIFAVGERTYEATAQFNATTRKYYYACPINVLEGAEKVRATLTYGGKEIKTQASVSDYVNYIVDHPASYGSGMVILAKKIANYIHYGQEYLKVQHPDTVVLGDDGYPVMPLFEDEDVNIEKAEEILGNGEVTMDESSSDGTSLYGRTIYFDHQLALNYYVETKDGEAPKVVCPAGVDVEVEYYRGKLYIVSVSNILPTEMAEAVEISVNGLKLQSSVLDYAAAVLRKGATEEAKKAMTALYEYGKAANDYVTGKK